MSGENGVSRARIRLPVDVEMEDRLAWGLTARQLVILVATALVCYGVFAAAASALPMPVAVALAAPLAFSGVALALGRRDGLRRRSALLRARADRRPLRLGRRESRRIRLLGARASRVSHGRDKPPAHVRGIVRRRAAPAARVATGTPRPRFLRAELDRRTFPKPFSAFCGRFAVLRRRRSAPNVDSGRVGPVGLLRFPSSFHG
jgi:hypothetical protein